MPRTLGSFSLRRPASLTLSLSLVGVVTLTYDGSSPGTPLLLCMMNEHCFPGEYYSGHRGWRACLWVPESIAEWTTAVALLLVLIYLIREYVVPYNKGCATRCRRVIEAIDVAVPRLSCQDIKYHELRDRCL